MKTGAQWLAMLLVIAGCARGLAPAGTPCLNER